MKQAHSIWRKSAKSLVAMVLMSTLGAAHAVRLHDIEVASYLNEPLKARIKISQAIGKTLVPSLASQRAFNAAGIERTRTLSDLSFTVGPDNQYIYVESSTPIREPFLLFLLRADHEQGHSTREIATLLDLPGTAELAQFDIPAAISKDAIKPFIANPALKPQVPEQRVKDAPTVAESPASTSDLVVAKEVLVRSGDTLTRIAQRYFTPGAAPSVDNFVQALFDLNPQAFIDGNINLLRAGALLQLPAQANTPEPARPLKPAPVPSSPTELVQDIQPIQTLPVLESGNANLTLVTDDGVVDDSEAEFLKQRIQELELQIAQLQQTGASRSEIGATIAEATGSALTPLAPVIEPVAPAPAIEAAPIAVVQDNPVTSVATKPTEKTILPQAAALPVVGLPGFDVDPNAWYVTYWQALAGGLAGLLALVLSLRLWRTRTAPVPASSAPTFENEVEPLFEAVDPAPEMVKESRIEPSLPHFQPAAQDRAEKALLMAAYGEVDQAINHIQDGLEADEDDEKHSLLRALARIAKGHDDLLLSDIQTEQAAEFPERKELNAFLAELSGNAIEPVMPATPKPEKPVAAFEDAIVLGEDENSIEMIEFTLELDDEKP